MYLVLWFTAVPDSTEHLYLLLRTTTN